MSYAIVLHPDAESEIDGAAEWYRKENERVATAFLEAVDRTIERISQNPLQFPMRSAELRHAIVTGFPYFLLFRVKASEALVTTVPALQPRPSPLALDNRRWTDQTHRGLPFIHGSPRRFCIPY